jgi:hypothetical protein
LASVPASVLEQELAKVEAQVAELEQVLGRRSARRVLLMALLAARQQAQGPAVWPEAAAKGQASLGPEPSASDT